MIPARRQFLIRFSKIYDLMLLCFSYFSAVLVCSSTLGVFSLKQALNMRFTVIDILFFLCFILCWSAIFAVFKIYHSWRISSLKMEILDLFKATSIGTLMLSFLSGIFEIDMVGISFLFLFWFEISFLAILSRIILRWLLVILRRRGRNLRHVVIVGTNEVPKKLAQVIETESRLGYRFLGFVENRTEGTELSEIPTGPVVANLDSFPNFIRDHLNDLDEIWIAIPMKTYSEQISRIEAFCHEMGIIVRFFSDGPNIRQILTQMEMFEGISALTRYPSPQMGWPLLMKRLADFMLSLVLLILLSPLLLCVVLVIKWTSSGPAFFIQERIGHCKRRFPMYKFRTMNVDAEKKLFALEHLNEFSGPAFKIKDDPRLTKVGKFLRKTSIDELPQLINVLKGEMSLVGPRPLPVRDYERFYEDKHYRRFSVLPGLTCLWQSNGRNSIPFDKWMELDLQYIDQWSFWLDIGILFKTIPSVFRGKGAS